MSIRKWGDTGLAIDPASCDYCHPSMPCAFHRERDLTSPAPSESPRESETQWVDGRLRQVRGDGTLGATCVHCVGLTAGLWCGACMDLDPRVLPDPSERA